MLPATSGEQSWFSAKARWIVFRSGTSKGSFRLGDQGEFGKFRAG